MTSARTVRDDLIEATGRVAVYSLLAVGLAYPDAARLDLLATRLLPAVAALELPAPLGGAIGDLAGAIPVDADVARAHHVALFPPIASQDAPGHETGYRGDGIFQQAPIMADIAGFYRAHGLRAGGSEKERPDHIVVELDFMSVVARKEALALDRGAFEDASVCRETAASFLQAHLGCWAPAFGRRVAALAASGWLRGLGELLAMWVESDMLILDVEPLEVVEGPLPQEPPDDGTCGPCPVGSWGER